MIAGRGSVGSVVLRASCEGSAGGSSGLGGRVLGQLVPGVRLPFAPGELLPGRWLVSRSFRVVVRWRSSSIEVSHQRSLMGGVLGRGVWRMLVWRGGGNVSPSLQGWVMAWWGSVRSPRRRKCSLRWIGCFVVHVLER